MQTPQQVFHWFVGIVSIQDRIVTVTIRACLYSDTGVSKITTSLSPRVLHIESREALCCNSLCFLVWTNMFRLLVKCITHKSQVLWAPHGGTGWARFICLSVVNWPCLFSLSLLPHVQFNVIECESTRVSNEQPVSWRRWDWALILQILIFQSSR